MRIRNIIEDRILLFTVAKEIKAKEITQRGIAAGLSVLFLLFLRIRVGVQKSESPAPEQAAGRPGKTASSLSPASGRDV
jgi:hypothetical protein